MPIIGMSDIKAIPQMIILGHLRKGAPKPTGNNAPKDLDHFRFDCNDPGMVTRFKAIYGDKPQLVRCILPYDDYRQPDGTIHPALYRTFDTWMTEYKGGKLQVQCDRRHIIRRREGQYLIEVDEPCRSGVSGTPCENCRVTGKLYLIVQELLPSEDFPEGRFGVVQVSTGSVHDISKLTQQLVEIQNTVGRLIGVPVNLSRRLESIPNPKSGQRQMKWLLNLELPGDFVSNQSHMRLLTVQVKAAQQLPPSVIVDDDEPEEEEETPSSSIQPAKLPETLPFQLHAPSSNPVEENENGLLADFYAEVAQKFGIDLAEARSYLAYAGLAEKSMTQSNMPNFVAAVGATLKGTIARANADTADYYLKPNSPKGTEKHFENALKQEGFDGVWPKAGDVDGWQVIYSLAVTHAQRRQAEESEKKADQPGPAPKKAQAQPLLPAMPKKEAKKRTGYEEF